MSQQNHIVLFEPQIPQNTGNIVKICAATNSLSIIKPHGLPIDDRKMKRARLTIGISWILASCESLDDFMKQMDGTTHSISKFAEKVYWREGRRVAFILYVRTKACLRNLCVSIQKGLAHSTNDQHVRSLNVSNTVCMSLRSLAAQNFALDWLLALAPSWNKMALSHQPRLRKLA